MSNNTLAETPKTVKLEVNFLVVKLAAADKSPQRVLVLVRVNDVLVARRVMFNHWTKKQVTRELLNNEKFFQLTSSFQVYRPFIASCDIPDEPLF